VRAVIKVSPDTELVELRDIETPALPPSGHARVTVVAAGICGTDLHIIDGSYSSRPPVALGHEVSGIVAEVSADVDPAWIGKPVAMETFFSTCGVCQFCRAGQPNMCAERVSIGSGTNGGFAETIIVPAKNLHELPASVDVVAGALSEPLACVCQSLFSPTPAVSPGDRVLVYGPGAVGLLAAQVARAAGAEVVIVGTASDATRLELAASLGFTTTLAPVTIDALPATWSLGPDVVIECSGAGPAMRSGLEIIRKHGRFVQMGQTGDLVSVPFAQLSFKELTVTGGFASTPTSWARAMTLLQNGLVDLAPLVSRSYPLEQWSDAFDATRRGDGVKLLLVP
jgi:L-iditol 2-dehydrogenase